MIFSWGLVQRKIKSLLGKKLENTTEFNKLKILLPLSRTTTPTELKAN